MSAFSLHPFPGLDSGGITIQGDIERTGQVLAFSFLLQGKVDDLILPPATGANRRDNLWQATCLELFWAEESSENYWELNLAPSGGWNVYTFTGYRTGMRQEERVAEPLITTERTPATFALTAELGITQLHAQDAPLRIGVSTVLQHRDSRLSYWSLAHPAEKPDFHAPQCFLLRM